MEQKFVFNADIPSHQISHEVSRKILAYSPNIMMVEMRFAAGGVGALHQHPHEQVTYILSGLFRFTNDGEEREVSAGDSLRFAPGTMHGTVCLEDGSLLDVFTPYREDFLTP